MPLLDPKFRYEHRIKWSIQNFHTCPSWYDLVITSPEFDIRLLDVLTLKFSLQTQGPGNSMLFAIHCDGFEAHHASLRVNVVVPVTEKQSTNSPARPRTEPLIPNAVLYFGLDGVHPSMPLGGRPLILQVTLRWTVEQGHYWSTMLNPHLVALSNDLVSMVTRPAYTNFVIESGAEESVRFDTHSCMLRARMPVLYQQGYVSMSDTGSSSDDSGRPVNRDVRVFVTDMSTEATRTLVFYLYGRMASTIPENQRGELLNFAQRLELKDLENMLTLYPTEYLLGTSLVMEDMCLNIVVADMRENTKMPKIWFPNSRNIKTAVSYKVFSDQYMEFAFSLDSFPQAPVRTKLTIGLKNASEQVLKEHELWHTFTDKKTWTAPRFVALGLADVHSISCRVQMIEGRFDQKEAIDDNNTREKATGQLLLFNNTLTFSKQLKKLYEDQAGCDFELHVGSRVLNVHKVIVVARSPMIRRLVKAKEKKHHDRSVVKVELKNEFPPESYQEVIAYMYCGSIKPKNLDHIDLLANVADYLDMPFLVEHLIFLTQ